MGYYFLRSEVRQTHASLTLPLCIWYFCTIRAVPILLPDIPICYFSIFIYLFSTLTQMYHGLRTLAHSLHFKYQWMRLLALEYSKGLFECVQASCMLPFVRVTRLCGVTWMEISVCACLRRVRCCLGRQGGKEKWQKRETEWWGKKKVE